MATSSEPAVAGGHWMDEHSPHAAVIHCGGAVCWANEAACELFEIDRKSVVGRLLRDYSAPECWDLIAQRITAVLEGGTAPTDEIVLRTATGRRLVVETRAVRTTWEGQAAVYLVLWDVTQRRADADRLMWVATHDQLTGLPNRTLLADRLSHALAGLHRAPGTLAVFFADLDGYKAVNDTLGHPAGDEVLQKVAERLMTALRPGDTVARWGGDEFVVVSVYLQVTDEAVVAATAERLRAAVEEPITVGAGEARVGVSIGWATTSAADADPEQLLKTADAAAYEAKRGRGPRPAR